MTGSALLAASQDLWQLSGRQFGSCAVLLRPCRQVCAPSWATQWWPGWYAGWWPQPVDFSAGWWFDAACGRCRGGCGCNDADTFLLPEPAQAVTQVLIDGVELPEGSGWTLYDGRLLVRTDGGSWPLCQDWTVPVSGIGAWSVTAVYGQPVPEGGMWALAQLAQEYVKFCQDGTCKLPGYTTSVVRQGVTQNFPTIVDLVDKGLTGLSWVDRFVDTWNPDRLRGGAQIWNPDDFADEPRRPGGAWV